MNEKIDPEEFQRAGSWARDDAARARRGVKVAWWIAAAASLIAVLLAITLIVVTPLKQIVPYTILVDRQTGYTVLVDPDQPVRISADSALTHSFLARYVENREGYSYPSISENYRKVMVWSSPDERGQYAATMDRDNPRSPFERFGRDGRNLVDILSVTSLSENEAVVRYATISDAGSPGATPQRWVATLDFAFEERPMALDERLVNPLGFVVRDYRTSPELLPTGSAETLGAAR